MFNSSKRIQKLEKYLADVQDIIIGLDIDINGEEEASINGFKFFPNTRYIGLRKEVRLIQQDLELIMNYLGIEKKITRDKIIPGTVELIKKSKKNVQPKN